MRNSLKEGVGHLVVRPHLACNQVSNAYQENRNQKTNFENESHFEIRAKFDILQKRQSSEQWRIVK